MHFIEHIIEPTRLLLAWQASDEEHRTRYIVAELNRMGEEINLAYLSKTSDFNKAQEHGFEAYPAFQDQDFTKTHHNVLDAFMRRLPPRTRGDFPQYLEGLRLRPNTEMSDFALLGYSGAKLLSDGFSIIHPFDNVDGPCELLLEAAGYKYIQNKNNTAVQIDQSVSFSKELFNQEEAVRIDVDGIHIGYVNRGLIPTFLEWMKHERIQGAWVEKINGTSKKPAVFLYIKVAEKK